MGTSASSFNDENFDSNIDTSATNDTAQHTIGEKYSK